MARRPDHEPHPSSYYLEACCHARLGNRAAATSALESAIREGWSDIERLAIDENLAALRGYPPFERIKNGGFTVQTLPSMQKGDALELELPGAMTLVSVGAFVDGRPWEGWGCMVAPSTLAVELAAPARVEPSASFQVRLETVPSASVWLVMKDTRVMNSCGVELHFAERMIASVKEMSKQLGSGWATASLESLLPAPRMELRKPYSAPQGVTTFINQTMPFSERERSLAHPAVNTVDDVQGAVCAMLVRTPSTGIAEVELQAPDSPASLTLEAFVIRGGEWTCVREELQVLSGL